MTFADALKKYRSYLVVMVLLLAGIYHQIVTDMVKDWYRDENYSHGFIIPFIAAYFFWLVWPVLKQRCISPSLSGLAVVAAGVIQLLFAWLGTEYFTMRTSLLVICAGIVLTLFGRGILRGMALPLGYLIFMVPIPYIIYDKVAFPLKLFVTKVSVAVLNAVGVVVMREGNIIMFPATTLEVADACSGIRSLMSLLALAVAYAFIINTSTLRRWIIIASAVPIAIATNTLRVVVTGILAQWWGERAAQGFFHEFAGFAVFAVAMVLLVAVGAVLKGKACDAARDAEGVVDPRDTLPKASLELKHASGVAICVILLAAGIYINTHRTSPVPVNRPFSEFPRTVGTWVMISDAAFSENVLKVLKPTDYIARQYRAPGGEVVNLYIGYHNGDKGSGGIHSPKNCLPGSGWYEYSNKVIPFQLGRQQEKIVRAVYKKGDSKDLFLYWFQMKGKILNNEYALKWGEISNSLMYGRKDETFVRISVPVTASDAESFALAERFVREFYPVIQEYLPQ